MTKEEYLDFTRPILQGIEENINSVNEMKLVQACHIMLLCADHHNMNLYLAIANELEKKHSKHVILSALKTCVILRDKIGEANNDEEAAVLVIANEKFADFVEKHSQKESLEDLLKNYDINLN